MVTVGKLDPQTLKTYIEIAAFGLAAMFLLGKLASGQFNDGMVVSLTADRYHATNGANDVIALAVHLRRNEIGRIELRDVLIELGDGSTTDQPVRLQTGSLRIREKKTAVDTLASAAREDGTFLPPGDGTQLGYLINVPTGKPVVVDVTVLARRTGLRFGRPQWRSSIAVLPVAVGK